MKRLVYTILPASSEVASIVGLDNEPVELLHEGPLAVACSVARSDHADVEQLLAYAGVVEKLFAVSDLLPLRHGCLLDEGGIVELLRSRRLEFLAGLEAVAGCMELGLRLHLASQADPAPRAVLPAATTGAAYLAARQAQLAARDATQTRAGDLQRELVDTFTGVARRVAVEPPRRDGDPFAAHFLVCRGDREPFETAFQAFRSRHDVPLVLTGPWPPYYFASVKDSVNVTTTRAE